MRWLIVDVGVIGSLIGTSLADTGEDVSYLVTDRKKIKIYEEYGISITPFPGEKRNHKINVIAEGAKGEYDIIIIPIRIHMYTSKLIEILKKLVSEKTLIIPVTAMFDLPENLMTELRGNVRAVMYPYAVGGRMLSDREILTVIPKTGSNLRIGKWKRTAEDEISEVIDIFNNTNLKMKKTSDPLSMPRIIAAFIVSLSREMAGRELPLTTSGLSNAALARVDNRFTDIIRILQRSGRSISFSHRLILGLAAFVRRSWVRQLLLGYFGKRLEHYRTVLSDEEINSFEEDLARMER